MEHFLAKIVRQAGADLSGDPAIHNRFVRYSKGVFNGPALKISVRGKTITIKASVDLENTLAYLVAANASTETVILDGSITAFEDPSAIVSSVTKDHDADISLSSKKDKWTIVVSGSSWTKEEAMMFFEAFNGIHGYLLVKVSLPGDKTQVFTIKTKLPTNKGEYDFDKAIGFCSAKLVNSAPVMQSIINVLVPDVASDANKAKEIIVENTYDITSLDIPSDPGVKNKRLAAKRKGELFRDITIDGKKQEFSFAFIA